MKIIGLTGSIACGKSTVSQMLNKRGAIIIDVDLIARKLLERNTQAWNEVKKAFGEDYFMQNQEIDRKKLGDAIFYDTRLREKLNHIMFPALKLEIEKIIAFYKAQDNVRLVIIDCALLFEADWQSMVDEIWVVKISSDEQFKRLMERDNITFKQAEMKIESQMSQERKIELADKIIDNSYSLSKTEDQIDKLWEQIQ